MLYLLLLSHAIPYASGFAFAGQMSELARRDALTCPTKKLTACPSHIPFCCPIGTGCIPLTPDKSSVLCCPENQDCSVIEAVSCDVSLQNPNKYPGVLLQTHRLHVTLPQCGKACCPLGFSCQDSHCILNDQSTSTQSTPSPTGSHSVTQIPTKAIQPIIIPTMAAEPTQSNFPAPAVVLGLFIGILVGVALTFLIRCILNKYRRKSKPSNIGRPLPPTRDGGHFAEPKPQSYVSEPTLTSDYAGIHRTDFLRTPERKQPPNEIYTSPPYPEPIPPKRPVMSDEFECRGIDPQNTATAAAGNGKPPITRHDSNESYISTGSVDRDSHAERSASTETISILMPPPLMSEGGPNGRGVSTNTTFSAMMERAGMKRGYGYAE